MLCNNLCVVGLSVFSNGSQMGGVCSHTVIRTSLGYCLINTHQPNEDFRDKAAGSRKDPSPTNNTWITAYLQEVLNWGDLGGWYGPTPKE